MKKGIICVVLAMIIAVASCFMAFAEAWNLNGLVANDILQRFNREVPISRVIGSGSGAREHMDLYGTDVYYNSFTKEAEILEIDWHIVEQEARALGYWARDKFYQYSNDPAIFEMGMNIGRSYEFYFGTDTGNNFYDNFPYIYGSYFGLKEYYASNGTRGREFYNYVKKDGIWEVSDQDIKQMYNDMQVFITACNNVIRAH